MIERPILDKIVYTFSQECNTNGTTGRGDDLEELEVTVESCVGSIETDGGFIVIRTKGWSINNSDELLKTISLVEKGVTLKVYEQ